MSSFFITHEDGTLDEYTATTISGSGTISASMASAMDGTVYGLQSTTAGLGSNAIAYLDFSAFSGNSFQISFWFDPNSLTMPTVNPADFSQPDITMFRVKIGAGASKIVIEMQYNGTNYSIWVRVRDDGGTLRPLDIFTIPNSAKFWEIIITKASSAISNDGIAEVIVDGTSQAIRSDLDLFTTYASGTRMEIGVNDSEGGISGTCYWDQIRASGEVGVLQSTSSFIADQGGGAAGGAGGSTGGSGGGGGMADISADGLYIYLAAFDSQGFPVIIKILATLTSDGSFVFQPGAGGRIAVQTGEFNADYVFAFGQFDGTNTVERSDDAGATFDVIDDGTFGTIRAFQVGPGDDNRILLFDGDNGDIIESLDGGETWTTINASVTQLVNSIARFDINPEEIVAGNQGDVTDSINYSPNSGANLEDYQTGVYPNADATKVIAN